MNAVVQEMTECCDNCPEFVEIIVFQWLLGGFALYSMVSM